MKKLLLAFAATAALCFGFTSCKNDVQDVNITNWDDFDIYSGSWSYLYSVSGKVGTTDVSSTYSYAKIGKSYSSGDNYTEVSVKYYLYDKDKAYLSSDDLDFYKINGKWYDKLGGPDAVDKTSYFTSGDPESSSFTYKDTVSSTTMELTFTRK